MILIGYIIVHNPKSRCGNLSNTYTKPPKFSVPLSFRRFPVWNLTMMWVRPTTDISKKYIVSIYCVIPLESRLLRTYHQGMYIWMLMLLKNLSSYHRTVTNRTVPQKRLSPSVPYWVVVAVVTDRTPGTVHTSISYSIGRPPMELQPRRMFSLSRTVVCIPANSSTGGAWGTDPFTICLVPFVWVVFLIPVVVFHYCLSCAPACSVAMLVL